MRVAPICVQPVEGEVVRLPWARMEAEYGPFFLSGLREAAPHGVSKDGLALAVLQALHGLPADQRISCTRTVARAPTKPEPTLELPRRSPRSTASNSLRCVPLSTTEFSLAPPPQPVTSVGEITSTMEVVVMDSFDNDLPVERREDALGTTSEDSEELCMVGEDGAGESLLHGPSKSTTRITDDIDSESEAEDSANQRRDQFAGVSAPVEPQQSPEASTTLRQKPDVDIEPEQVLDDTTGEPPSSELIDLRLAQTLDSFFSNDRCWQQVARELESDSRLLASVSNSVKRRFTIVVPASHPGLQYRRSKVLKDRYSRYVKNGRTVSGYLEDNGAWLRLADNVFLPSSVNGMQLLVPATEDVEENTADTAGSSPAVTVTNGEVPSASAGFSWDCGAKSQHRASLDVSSACVGRPRVITEASVKSCKPRKCAKRPRRGPPRGSLGVSARASDRCAARVAGIRSFG